MSRQPPQRCGHAEFWNRTGFRLLRPLGAGETHGLGTIGRLRCLPALAGGEPPRLPRRSSRMEAFRRETRHSFFRRIGAFSAATPSKRRHRRYPARSCARDSRWWNPWRSAPMRFPVHSRSPGKGAGLSIHARMLAPASGPALAATRPFYDAFRRDGLREPLPSPALTLTRPFIGLYTDLYNRRRLAGDERALRRHKPSTEDVLASVASADICPTPIAALDASRGRMAEWGWRATDRGGRVFGKCLAERAYRAIERAAREFRPVLIHAGKTAQGAPRAFPSGEAAYAAESFRLVLQGGGLRSRPGLITRARGRCRAHFIVARTRPCRFARTLITGPGTYPAAYGHAQDRPGACGGLRHDSSRPGLGKRR